MIDKNDNPYRQFNLTGTTYGNAIRQNKDRNFNEKLKEREANRNSEKEEMSLDSTERIKVLSPGQLVFKRFINNKLAILGTFILLAMFLFSFVAPLFYPYSQTEIFYKYDNSVVDYAQATERKEYSFTYLEGAEELHYSVKNNLTSNINSMKSEGLKEMSISDSEGNIYILNEDDDCVYTLLKEEAEKVATLSASSKYATYSVIGSEISYESGVEQYPGFEDALKLALNEKRDAFSTSSGMEFTLEKVKKTYNVYAAGGSIIYEGSKKNADFEALATENKEGGNFSFAGDTYTVVKNGDESVVSLVKGESPVAVLTTYVFDAYEDETALSKEFETAALTAFSNGMKFEEAGNTYELKKVEDEYVVYDSSDKPVCALSTEVIRRYNGEDNLGYAFKEKARETIADMNSKGEKTSEFTWEIAQVNADGEYTYDENGNLIKEERPITITNKGGSYVMSVSQVVYLIDTFDRPSREHLAGTDGDGMDVLSRMMYGGRVSLIFSFVVIILETLIGVVLGGIAGYFGGWVDNLIMRLVDIFYCIPHMPILIILGAMFDALKMKPYVRVGWLMIVLGILSWAGVARLVRGQILSLREQEFMVATEAVGLKTKRRIFKHLIPNVMPQLIVTATSGLGDVIITESTLSFLGLGVKHPLATWGTMINSVSTAEAMKSYTYIWVPVGILICLTVVAFNFVGDGLRDAFDPKMKR